MTLLFSFLFFLSSFANEGEFLGQGQIAIEFRQFENDSISNSEESNLSLFSRIEESYESDSSKHVLRGFGRVDRFDENRNLMAIEDAYFSTYLGEEDTFRVLAGYKIFNWTATEAFHPADVINSRNFDSNIENFEKKGQLVLELEKTFDTGGVNFYYFPRFEEPEFPGSKSRLGAGVNIAKPQIYDGSTKSENNWAPQFGARLAFVFDFADISVHYLNHIDRTQFIAGTDDYTYNTFLQSYFPTDLTAFTENPTPYFFRVHQVGGTLTIPITGILFKFEGAARFYEDDSVGILTARGLRRPVDHQEVAFGIEYPWSSDLGIDFTFIFEGTGVFGVDKQTRAELNVFQRDLFIGLRTAFNDSMGKELLISTILDVERTHEIFFNFSYSQRLSDIWKVSLGLRFYEAPREDDYPLGLESYDGDNHFGLTLTRFF